MRRIQVNNSLNLESKKRIELKKSYFISDLHFGLESSEKEKEKEAKLIRLIEEIKNDAENLFILGDLFDYWFEYNSVIQKGYYKLFTALEELVSAGCKVYYIIGNHDFMHKDFFEKYLGVNVIEDTIEIEIAGKRFFLGHGDGLIKNDIGYKIIKKIFRNKYCQMLYSIIHPDLGIAIAKKTSKSSRDYTSDKDYGEKDWLFEKAKELMDGNIDYVVFGHSHKRKTEIYKGKKYINLGTWLDKPCYAVFNGNDFELKFWELNG